MEIYRNPGGSWSRVALRSSRDWNHEVRNEFADTAETCFVRLATQYAVGHLTLSDYLDGVLSHLRKGATKHEWDVPPEDISDFLELDLFAGAVKARHLLPAFVPLEEDDYYKAKQLASRSWTTNDPDEFDRLGREDQPDPSVLRPEIADLLLVICYARRHTLLFSHLIALLPGPPDLNEILLQPRTAYWTAIHQHARKQQSNSADEISMWTDILNFGFNPDKKDKADLENEQRGKSNSTKPQFSYNLHAEAGGGPNQNDYSTPMITVGIAFNSELGVPNAAIDMGVEASARLWGSGGTSDTITWEYCYGAE